MKKYIPHTDDDIKEMLDSLEKSSIDELFEVIPLEFRLKEILNLPEPLSELELIEDMEKICRKNKTLKDFVSFIGGGCYDHFIPSAISHLTSRSEFWTSYTPYQPELSQGTLQGIFEFQTMICSLLGMDISNASLYDGATSIVEAILLCRREKRKKDIIISSTLHPEYKKVIKTYIGDYIEIKMDQKKGVSDICHFNSLVSDNFSCAVIQNPNFFGCIEDVEEISKIVNEKDIPLIVSFTEPIAFGLISPPGECGADIAAGEGQSLGLPPSFGGPHLGIIAGKERFLNKMPGRISGWSIDRNNNECYVLTLAAREQHIRRERATSNICTNQALCALTATIYLSIVGPSGLKKIAKINHLRSEKLKSSLKEIDGIKIKYSAPTFNEFVITTQINAKTLFDKLKEKGFLAGLCLGRFYKEMQNDILLTLTEMNDEKDIDNFINALKKSL